MIFLGDISLPFKDSIKFKSPGVFFEKKLFGNLEGAIVENSEDLKSRTIVFNDEQAINSLIEKNNFSGFALANNHIFDAGTLEGTVCFLKSNNIPYCGIGSSLNEANEPLILKEEGKTIIILNFGWEVIQCEVTYGDYPGVNPLRKNHVIETVKKALKDFPAGKVIPFMHWSYELEGEPQPFERELAMELIDLGVSGVIGCHPHRIGGFEMYKEKPIVYSLGNWMFRQNFYFDGKLKFPDFCNQELAFEWDFRNNDIKFHFFNYKRENSTLTYTHSENIESETMKRYTPFRGMTDKEYRNWYKKNHYHKNKGLPIYYYEDSESLRNFKNKVNKVRDLALQTILKIRK